MIVCPQLPWKRNLYHFNEGDNVRVYYSKQNKWKRGIVVKGYKYHKGYVSFYLNGEKVPKYDYLEIENGTHKEKEFVDKIGKIAHSRGIGNNVPLILKEEEFNFFIENKHEWLKWKSLVSIPPYNGEFLELKKTPSIKCNI